MIVEVKGNESLIDQIENAALNISRDPKKKLVTQSRHALTSSSSLLMKSSSAPLAPHLVTQHPSSDASNDLMGHESHPPADIKYVNDSRTQESVDKCWIEGEISCKDSQLTCTGFGEIDCRGRECTTSPTLACNMDLRKASCRGHGSCKKNDASGRISSGTMSLMATTIVVVAISLGVLVLSGTVLYVYFS